MENETAPKNQPHSKHFYYMLYIIVGLLGVSIIIGLIGIIGHSWISAAHQAPVPQVEHPSAIIYKTDSDEPSQKRKTKKKDKDDDDDDDDDSEIIGDIIKGAIKIIPAFL